MRIEMGCIRHKGCSLDGDCHAPAGLAMTVVSVAAAVYRSALSFRACAAGVGIRSLKPSSQGEAFCVQFQTAP